jgi:hypothetical protein
MNLLTQTRPQSELVQILKSTQHTQTRKETKKKYRYPTAEEEFKALDLIFNQEFSRLLTDYEKKACKMLAKVLTMGVAYHDIYELACGRITLSTHQLCQYLTGWDDYEPALQNRWIKGAKRYLNTRDGESTAMKALFSQQARVLDRLDDETAGKVLDLEPGEIEVQYATDLRTYLAPGKEALMSCGQICEYLITLSGGACIKWPHHVGRELDKRGFEKGEAGYYVKLNKIGKYHMKYSANH